MQRRLDIGPEGCEYAVPFLALGVGFAGCVDPCPKSSGFCCDLLRPERSFVTDPLDKLIPAGPVLKIEGICEEPVSDVVNGNSDAPLRQSWFR